MDAFISKKNKWWFSDLDDLIGPFKKYVIGKKFLDLGSGDGRVLSMAFELKASEVKGIENDEFIHERCQMKEKVICGDLFDEDFSKHEVIYYFIGCKHDQKIKEKLNKEFQGDLIIYHKKVNHFVEDFEEGLDFELVEKFPHVRIYRRFK